MTYLYGDSTESGLRSNFLELLRDALDFAVCVLEADETIADGKTKAEAGRRHTHEELARLDAFIAQIAGAIDGAEKGDEESATARAAAQVAELLRGVQRATGDGVRARLAADLAAIDAIEASTRTACHDALAAFLAPHGPSDAPAVQRVTLVSGAYEPTLAGRSSFGVDWVFGLHVPEGNLWAGPLRLDRVAESLEIRAPQVAGWINKEVKVRPQRIERHTVTALTHDAAHTYLALRADASGETGFDVEVDRGGETPAVRTTRVGPAGDAATGAFDVDPADVPPLLAVVDRILEAADDFEIGSLVEARDGDHAFRDSPVFAPLVGRLVARLAPVVREIARRSLTPSELVLRRALADDRREEIFVTKASLREKYAPLPERHRALFAPLGLDDGPPQASVRDEAATAERSEIRRSAPPPKPPPPPARPRAAPSSAPTAPGAPNKNEAFVEAVTKIMLVLKSGRTDEGYSQYADLLSSDAFGGYHLDEQRKALKLLLLARAPDRSDAVTHAYRIALARIQALVDTHAEPADYEMLGVAHVQLEDKEAATAAFEIALKLERARDPASELCASLSRRMSQLG